jgi:hypothetical protein
LREDTDRQERISLGTLDRKAPATTVSRDFKNTVYDPQALLRLRFFGTRQLEDRKLSFVQIGVGDGAVSSTAPPEDHPDQESDCQRVQRRCTGPLSQPVERCTRSPRLLDRIGHRPRRGLNGL